VCAKIYFLPLAPEDPLPPPLFGCVATVLTHGIGLVLFGCVATVLREFVSFILPLMFLRLSFYQLVDDVFVSLLVFGAQQKIIVGNDCD
jgi:hypothetical protein